MDVQLILCGSLLLLASVFSSEEILTTTIESAELHEEVKTGVDSEKQDENVDEINVTTQTILQIGNKTKENVENSAESCQNHLMNDNYSAQDTFCNMYHTCLKDATGNYKKFSFLCPPGSSFNSDKQICDIMINVNCTSEQNRRGKNMFTFAIKTMYTGEGEQEEGGEKVNPKKARQELPRM